MNVNSDTRIGQTLHGTTWGEGVGQYDDHANGRFAWFKQAKFGIFIHWGVYSLLEGEWRGREYRGIAEWIMRKLAIPVTEYEALARDFNPAAFDAGAWLDLFKEAGAQYVTITAKHHDGFCLFNSAASDFNVVKHTRYGRDVIHEVSRACAERGLRLCLYYSQDQDWHEPDGGGNDWDFRPESRTAQGRRRYVENKVMPQVRELLSGYGPVGYIWFDTPGYLSAEDVRSIKQTVTEMQPECMSSSRLGHNLGDFESLPDQMVPTAVSNHRCETAMTHNDSWAFSKFDHNWKSAETLIRQLVETVSCGANYLLNVGPMQDGSIPKESVAALKRIGAWLKTNGDSIYACQPNPLGAALPWGVCTAKPGKIYVHVMEPPNDRRLVVPCACEVGRAVLLATGDVLPFRAEGAYVVIDLPETLPDPVVSVIVLELAMTADRMPLLLANQTCRLRAGVFTPDEGACVRSIRWMHETFGNWRHRDILCLQTEGASARVTVDAPSAGMYRVSCEYDFPPRLTSGSMRHTLEGSGSLEPRGRNTATGRLSVDGDTHDLRFPFVAPGYFETKQVCSETIAVPAGRSTIELTAGSDIFPEIAGVTLTPASMSGRGK